MQGAGPTCSASSPITLASLLQISYSNCQENKSNNSTRKWAGRRMCARASVRACVYACVGKGSGADKDKSKDQ